MLCTSVEGGKKPAPTPYLVGVHPLAAARYIDHSPPATATRVGPGWVCQPVKPPGWIVSTWKTMSQAVAPQVICGWIPGTCTFTRTFTVPFFVFTRTVRVTVTAFGVPSTSGSVALPTEPRAGYTLTAFDPGVPNATPMHTDRAIGAMARAMTTALLFIGSPLSWLMRRYSLICEG